MQKLLEKKHLPNQQGFKFIAIYPNNKEVMQEVKVDPNGLHYVDNFSEIIFWREIEK